jgi:cytochrome oxidase Cu insertion factor (SCO1/SenC/PrrC family)
MEISTQGRLEERLARLERQGRWWRAAALSLALVLGVLLTAAFGGQNQFDRGFILPPQRPEGIRARAFLLTDSQGKVQGEWTIEGGQPVLKLYGKDGRVVWYAPPRAEMKPVN